MKPHLFTIRIDYLVKPISAYVGLLGPTERRREMERERIERQQ